MAGNGARFVAKVANHAAWKARSFVPAASSTRTLYEGTAQTDSGRREHVTVVAGPAVIEPHDGYVFGPGGRLIYDSLYPNFEPHHPPWRMGCPSVVGYARLRLLARGKGRSYPRVVSLRHFWEWNYYHFLLDVLGKLQLLDEAGVPRDTPIVLGAYARELPWVEPFLRYGELANRRWVIPEEGEYISADEVIYCRTLRPHVVRTDFLLDEMGVDPVPPGEERIFLGREDAKNRQITNFADIEPILAEHGFRIVRSLAGLHGPESMPIFANARYLVAVHGAGLTNILFRRRSPMSVMELHPDGYISTDFRQMCEQRGYSYDTLAGPAADPADPMGSDFTIDPSVFRERLDRMIGAGEVSGKSSHAEARPAG